MNMFVFRKTTKFASSLSKNHIAHNQSRFFSQSWMQRQISDPYVKKRQVDGYVSRAAYKLLQMDKLVSIFPNNSKLSPNFITLDLGSAPGGWTQVALRKQSNVISVDLVPLDSLVPNSKLLKFVQGDINELAIQQQVEKLIQSIEPTKLKVDVVLCDIAPKFSGQHNIDSARTDELARMALSMALKYLPKGSGSFLVKLLKGGLENTFLADVKSNFQTAKFIKPDASRNESSEVYVYGKNKL